MVAQARSQDFFSITVPKDPDSQEYVRIDVKVYAPSPLPNFGYVNIISSQVNLCLLDRALFSVESNYRRQATLSWNGFKEHFGLSGARFVRINDHHFELIGFFNLTEHQYYVMLHDNRWPQGLRTYHQANRNGLHPDFNGNF